MNDCDYRCEDGLLPTDGTEDAIYLEDDGVVYEYLPLLLPTEYRPCFVCNPESYSNDDLKGVVIL